MMSTNNNQNESIEENNKSSARSISSNAVKMSHTVGLIWCTVQGLSRGCMYSGQKIAQEATNVDLSHIVMLRSLYIMLGAYLYGKWDGVDFSPSVYIGYEYKIQKLLFLRSLYGYLAIVCAMVSIMLCPASIAVSIMMT